MTSSGWAAGDLVSIVIPVFNGAKFVGEAIESALAQSWPQVEVIVVDDGSDDGGATRRVLDRYGDAIRVLAKPNGGVATALNAGIAAMRGSWFSWLSHDDVYHPLKIERYLAALRGEAGPAIAFGDVDLVDENGRLLRRSDLARSFEGRDGRWAVLEGRLNGCAMLVPRVCLDACGMFDPGLPTTQDYAYWFRLAQRFPFIPVDESLVRWREHADQGSRTSRHLEEASLLWVGMLESLETAHPEATPRERIEWLPRAERFLRRTSYAGARAYVGARLGALLGAVPVAVVLPARSDADLEPVMTAMAAAGGRPAEVVVIDRTEDAAAALALTESPRLRGAAVLRLSRAGAALDPAPLLAAAAGLDASLVAFLDSAALPTAEALREGLLTVASGEADGWLPGRASAAATLPDELCGGVVGRDALTKAATDRASAGMMAALARDARLVGEAGLPDKAPPPSPEPPARPRRPKIGEWPMLGRAIRPGRPTLLMLVHAWGGGTIRYAATLAASVEGRVNVLYAWGVDQRRFYLSSIAPDIPELEYDLDAGLAEPVAALHRLKLSRVDVLHSIGFDSFLEDFLDRLGLPFDLTFLDYHHLARDPHLLDEAGHFVGDAALLRTDHPVLRAGPLRPALRAADRRIACSRDLAARIGRLALGLPVIPARLPEPGNPGGFAIHAPPLAPSETMRVLYLGRLAQNKGMHLVPEVARLISARGIDLRIYSLGVDADFPSPEFQGLYGIRLLGGYRQSELNSLICRLRPHLAWLPFTAAETHSFSLSDAMLQGLPILTTGIGAVPERTADRPATWQLAPEEATAEGFADWLERLWRDQLRTPPRWLPTAHLPPIADRFYEREYLRPLFQHAG
jgi:glycosyltransferase involved in cell wall biosynthesis